MLEENNKEGTEPTARLVRALFILPPLFCYFLARVQGASEQGAVVIGLAA
jgi:hypothetical protein